MTTSEAVAVLKANAYIEAVERQRERVRTAAVALLAVDGHRSDCAFILAPRPVCSCGAHAAAAEARADLWRVLRILPPGGGFLSSGDRQTGPKIPLDISGISDTL